MTLLLQEHLAGCCSIWCLPGPPSPFLSSSFSVGWPPACTGARSCSPPQVQDLTLVLVELLKVAVSLFFQPDEMPLDGSMIFWCISHSSQFVSPENPLRVNSAPASKSLMKMLDRNGPNIGHVFYFHVLCHQGPCPSFSSVFSSFPFATYSSSSCRLCHYCPD